MQVLALKFLLLFLHVLHLANLDGDDWMANECCVDWIEPCKCPRLYITPDERPCASELDIADLNFATFDVKVDETVQLLVRHSCSHLDLLKHHK